MGTISLSLVDIYNDPLNLVTTGPLGIAWMFVDPPDVLSNLWLDDVQEEVIDRVQCVREDEFRPRQYSKFITSRVEIVASRQFIRRLIRPSTPDSQL